MADLVREAKAAPDRFNYGAPNPGAQIVGERIKQIAGIDMLRVPYRSTPQALTDVIAGNTTMTVVDVAAALANLTSGQVRALAITTARRTPLLPDVPTLQEAGFKDFDVTYWNCLFGPAGLPAEVVATLGDGADGRDQDARPSRLGWTGSGLPCARPDGRLRADRAREVGRAHPSGRIEPN